MTLAPGLTMVMQSLDNKTRNPMAVAGWVAGADQDEDFARQEAMRLINEVTLAAPYRLSRGGRGKAFRGPWSFVLEVIPEDEDVAGRRSPLVCQGRIADVQASLDSALAVVQELSAFCARHDRSPFPAALQDDAAEVLLDTLRERSTSNGPALPSLRRVLRTLGLK